MSMSRLRWHDFLLKNALFPFPEPKGTESTTTSTTEISQIEAGMLESEWKAIYAVRDDGLVQKLCHTLQVILGDGVLAARSKNDLLAYFSPRLQDDLGLLDEQWSTNSTKAEVSKFSEGFQIFIQSQAIHSDLTTESGLVSFGSLRSGTQVFGGIWWISL
jgi:hypothetical protein